MCFSEALKVLVTVRINVNGPGKYDLETQKVALSIFPMYSVA